MQDDSLVHCVSMITTVIAFSFLDMRGAVFFRVKFLCTDMIFFKSRISPAFRIFHLTDRPKEGSH